VSEQDKRMSDTQFHHSPTRHELWAEAQRARSIETLALDALEFIWGTLATGITPVSLDAIKARAMAVLERAGRRASR